MLSRRATLAGLAAIASVPAAARAPSLPFLVLGDWGREGQEGQADVAAAMGRQARADGSRFVLSLGDNFYENGVAGTEDPQWTSSFEAVYADPALLVPWFSILGNHDYRGDVAAQLRYRGPTARWRMPARYYAREERLADGTVAAFFHIDTSPFLSRYRGTRTHVVGQDTAAQLRWLDRALAASTAAWKLVVGHHPLVTATGGKQDNPELIGPLLPLFRQYGVQAYLAGHIHNLQETTLDGVCCVVSGAGSELGPVRKIRNGGFAMERHGFVAAELAQDALALRYVDDAGGTLRETVLRRG